MGTSLSGLTPATTFDGLLKTSDNEPLDGTLKAISTGDGTDTILNLSTTAFKIGGETIVEGATTGDFFKVRNASNPNQFFKIQKQFDSLNIFKLGTNNTGIQVWDNEQVSLFVSNFSTPKVVLKNNGSFGIGEISPTSRLQVKGSGTTSATTSLLVQNSAGGNIIKANDDGRVLLGVGTDYQNHLLELNGEGLGDSQTLLRLQSSVNFMGAYTGIGFTNSTNGSSLSSEIRAYRESYGNAMTFNFAGTEMLRATSEGNLGIGETTPTARLQVKGSGNDNTTNAFLVQNSDGTEAFKIQDNRTSVFSGVASFGSVIYSSSDFRGSANLTAGSSTIPANTRAYIKGSGTTSATTALLVQNSAGTDLLKVLDDGSVFSNGGGAKISSNTGFGQGVLASVTTANNTSAFGVGALQAVTTGVSNTGLGWRAGYSTTGSNNAFVGLMAGYTNSSGSNNTGLGTRVLYDNATGSDNTAIGFRADSDGFSGSVILGKDATATADNQFVVGSSGINAGTVANIGDPNPTHTWEVVINGTKYRILLQEVV